MKRSVVLVFVLTTLFIGTAAAQDGPRRADFIGMPYVEDGHERQVVDVYLPTVGEPPYPTLVMFHGGGFSGGDRAQYRRLALHYADQGYVVITPEYRLQPPAEYPQQLHDAFCAMGWLYANAAAYDIDTSRIVTWGDSAGGYFAAMVGMADPLDEWLEGCPYELPAGPLVQGVISFYGVLDFTDPAWHLFHHEVFVTYFGVAQEDAPELWTTASPVTWIDADDPPALLIHHDEDFTVPVALSTNFAAAMETAGVEVTLYVIEDLSITPVHGFITDNRPESPRVALSLQLVDTFLESVLRAE